MSDNELKSCQIKYAWFVSYTYTDTGGSFLFGNTILWMDFEVIQGISGIRDIEKATRTSLEVEFRATPSNVVLLYYRREESADKLFPVDTRPRLTRAK